MAAKGLVMPPRSMLLRPEPKGLGTGQVQSISSYLFDVAALHEINLGQLVSHFWPERKRSKLGYPKQPYEWVTKEALLVEAFAPATMRTDLHCLTLLPWEPIITCNGLRSKEVKWCSQCLADAPYGRLLWMFAEAKACPIHEVMLESACEGCGTVTKPSAMRPSWLHCTCGHKHSDAKRTSRAGVEEIWTAAQLSDLLALGQRAPNISITRLQDVLRIVLRPLFGTTEDLMRHTGLSWNALYGHFGQNMRMPIPGLLGTARSTGLTLVDLLTANLEDLRPVLGPPATTVTPRRQISKTELQSLVKAAMASIPEELRTVNSVAAKIGVSKTRIENQLPEIAAQLYGDSRERHRAAIVRNDAIALQKMTDLLLHSPLMADATLAYQCGMSFTARAARLVAQAHANVALMRLPKAA